MKFDYDNAQVGLLGTLMLGAFDDAVSDGITEEWFDGLKNKSVWTLINRIYLNSEKPNMDFMSSALADSEWSGKVGELIHYIDSAPTKHNYPYWKEICHDGYLRKRMVEFGNELQRSAVDCDDINLIADEAENKLFEMRKMTLNQSHDSMQNSFKRIMESLQKAHEGSGLIGLPSGFEDVDRHLSGLRDGAMYTIAARPGMGKSTMAMNIAEHLAVNCRIPTAFFSLEMSEDELNQRILANRTGANLQAFYRHDISKQERESIMHEMQNEIPVIQKAPLHLCSRTDMTISQLRAEARRMVSGREIKIIIVDYLQLIGGEARKNSTRVDEVGLISRGIKQMALELNVPVIALAQLNRSIENDGERLPRLADLRESGSIEADSDCVLFIHRPTGGAVEGGRMLCQIVIGKNRNGAMGKFDICFNRDYSRFENIMHHVDLLSGSN